MAEDKIEEDTYSLILTSLKHPLRRKILRILSDGPLGFSQIAESLSIDSGHLNYHIKSLGDLVTHTKEGKYALSTAGWAAVRLMGKVEEQEEAAKVNKRQRRISKTALIFSVIFAVCLLTATIYALTFTTQEENYLFGEVLSESEKVYISFEPRDQFNYNFSLNPWNNGFSIPWYTGYYGGLDYIHGGYSIGQNETNIFKSPKPDSIIQWTRYFSRTSLFFNGTGSVEVAVHDPNNRTIIYYFFSKQTSEPADVLQEGGFEFSTSGTYKLQIAYFGEGSRNAILVPRGLYISYTRPLFGYGIAGLVVLLLYPILLLIVAARLPKKTEVKKGEV